MLADYEAKASIILEALFKKKNVQISQCCKNMGPIAKVPPKTLNGSHVDVGT